MFRYVELKLPALPNVSVDQGIYTVAFALPLDGGTIEPVMTVEGVPGQAVSLSCVLSRAILSIEALDLGQSVALFPDGRFLSRSNETLFQDGPTRRGAQIIHGDTSVTISPEGRVIVVGGDFSLVIDNDGSVFRQDDPPPHSRPMPDGRGADDPAGEGAGNGTVLPFRARDEDPDDKA